MSKTNQYISLLILYLCISMSCAQTASQNQTTGTQLLPGSQKAILIRSQSDPIKQGNIRFHQFTAESSLQLIDPNSNQGKNIDLKGNQYFALFDDTQDSLCSQNKFRKCYLAVGHGYDNNGQQDSKQTSLDDTLAVAYIGFNEADNYAIAFQKSQQGRFSQNWAYTFVHAADKTNPYNQNSDAEADCNKEVKLQGFETTKSQYSQSTLYTKAFPNIITEKQQNYKFGLLTQKDNIQERGSCYIDPQEDISLRGQTQINLKRSATKDVSLDLAGRYRAKLGENPQFISKSAIQKFREQKGQLNENDDGKDPIFSQIDNIDDPQLLEPIDFQKYLNGQGDFQKDYPDKTYQARLLTIQQPSISVNNEKIQSFRLLPVVATHTLYEETKIIYSKTVLGKKIQVKLYAKCSLIISASPTKHQVSCFGQIIYTIFSVTKTKNLFSFTKQVATYWSWSQNWGGNWGFSFGVPLPPPVSFITINFYVTVSYGINLGLYSKVLQWWYPLIHEVKAVASSQLNVDATASIRVIAVQGGVYIKGTIVKVSTDPTATLYYYLKDIHRFIIVWVKWYWQIIAFQFEWGFKWRYWFFGWSSWKTIAKWNIYGVYGKFKILNKAFFLSY